MRVSLYVEQDTRNRRVNKIKLDIDTPNKEGEAFAPPVILIDLVSLSTLLG